MDIHTRYASDLHMGIWPWVLDRANSLISGAASKFFLGEADGKF
jgi:hypothetical protein